MKVSDQQNTSTPLTLQRELLRLARQSIEQSLREGGRGAFPQAFSPELAAPRASFITLRNRGELRGCCGSIEAVRPFAHDVWHNAWAAAFCDPRFPLLSAQEWPRIDVHISALTEPTEMNVASEQELLQRLTPGIDGLILELGGTRATFLPSVWEQLPEPREFLRHLKTKAGWSANFWSPRIRVQTYTVESFGNVSGDEDRNS